MRESKAGVLARVFIGAPKRRKGLARGATENCVDKTARGGATEAARLFHGFIDRRRRGDAVEEEKLRQRDAEDLADARVNLRERTIREVRDEVIDLEEILDRRVFDARGEVEVSWIDRARRTRR